MEDLTSPGSQTSLTSVRFFAGETLSEGLDRVIDDQFEIALGIATSAPDEQASAVHETRKAIKRLRAMLRLVRDSISLDCYHTDCPHTGRWTRGRTPGQVSGAAKVWT